MAKKKLKFLRSRQYLDKKVLRGQTVEVDDFWARIFIADGTAEAAGDQKKAKKKESKK